MDLKSILLGKQQAMAAPMQPPQPPQPMQPMFDMYGQQRNGLQQLMMGRRQW